MCNSRGLRVFLAEPLKVRHFRFNIDLTKGKKLGQKNKAQQPSRTAPPPSDGFALSEGILARRQSVQEWPRFQFDLEQLPRTLEPGPNWDDTHLAREYIRVYEASQRKILDATPGFVEVGKTETHCFFSNDGCKHLVSRLLSQPHTRVTELTLTTSGDVTRNYYENSGGQAQDTDDLLQNGLDELLSDEARFARYPHYHLRFFMLQTRGELLEETYRGMYLYDPSTNSIVCQNAEQL